MCAGAWVNEQYRNIGMCAGTWVNEQHRNIGMCAGAWVNCSVTSDLFLNTRVVILFIK